MTHDTPRRDMTAVFVELLYDTAEALMEGLNYCQRRLTLQHPGFSPSGRKKAAAAVKREAKAAKPFRLGRAATATRVSFAAFAAAHGVTNPLVCSGAGWQHCLDALRIRDRITHPRFGSDCSVSDVDLALVRRVHRWYQRASERLMELPRGPAA